MSGDLAGDLARAPPTMEFLLQPINITLLEEVNDNNGAIEPVTFPVTAPAELALPLPASSCADAQIYWAETEAADVR